MDNIPRSAKEYRKWWAENTDVPYGECWCGCGIRTTLSQVTARIHGYIKGEPCRFLHGHANRLYRKPSREDFRRRWEQERPDIPYGLCWCGCGEQTKLAVHTNTARGLVKGEPGRFLKGHRVRGRSVRFCTWQPGEESTSMSISNVAFRICHVCGCTKPLDSSFFARQTRKGGSGGRRLARLCLICSRLDAKAYWDSAGEEQRERVRVRMRGYYRREKPEARNKKAKEWRRKNPEKAREFSRRAMERQQERIEQDEEYRSTVRLWSVIATSRRRARLRGADGSYTAADIQQMYEDQGGLCAYCEASLNGNYHTDHMISLSRGGSNDALNIALSCQPCNLSKFTKTVEEFYAEYLA